MVLLSPRTIVSPVAPATVGFSYAGMVVLTEYLLPVVNAGLESCSVPNVGVASGEFPPPELPGLLFCAHSTDGVTANAAVRIDRKITFTTHFSYIEILR